MSNDNDWVLGLVMLVLLLGAVGLFQYCQNEGEEHRCKSLRKQGVPAYVSEGFISKKCHAVGREIVD